MFASLKRLLSRQTRKAPARSNRRPLAVEALESREVMTVGFTQLGGTLTIFSNNLGNVNENVRIIDNGSAIGNNISVSINNGPVQGFAGNIRNINVALGIGNDTVTYQMLGGLGAGGVRNVGVDLGAGNDVFSLAAGSLGTNARFNVNAFGGQGVDVMTMQAISGFRTLPFTTLRVSTPWSLASGASFSANLNGGTETDVLRFDHNKFPGIATFGGIPPASVAANAALAVTMNGAAGNDQLFDTVVADVALGGRHSAVQFGEAGDDLMRVVGHPLVTQRPTVSGTLTRVMLGGDGNDNMVADVKANIASTGSFASFFSGGLGNDIIDFGYTGKMDGQLFLTMLGEQGNDALAARLIIAANSASTGRVGSAFNPATVDGGIGNDNLRFQTTVNNPVTYAARMLGGAGFDVGTHSPLTVQAQAVESLLAQNLFA